uniref:ribosomal protein L22 n=1 Tax=Tetraselmis marina TaxID=41888 RepID=UPI0021AD05AD|nr:ribosomal protein L22 [Tetraselmis marina]UUA64550.1 ribosomal protein L22 [Tetraselmis marina]
MKKKNSIDISQIYFKPVLEPKTDPTKKPTWSQIAIAGLAAIFLILIVLIPILIVFSSNYWKHFLLAPKLYLSSLIFFLCPFCIILIKPIWRCPFFVAPFSISFIIASLTITYSEFLINYWFYLGFILTVFAYRRTIPPWRSIELNLHRTDYFMDYFEVQRFWRIVVILSCPLFFIIKFTLFNFIC